MLLWAREEAGLTPVQAADKAKVDPGKLAAWESGEDAPTLPQLRTLAKIYKRSLAVFYLPKPPKDFRVAVTDYRRFPGDTTASLSPQLRIDLRLAEYHRQVALDVMSELGEEIAPSPLSRFGASLQDDPEILGARIRDLLHIEPGTHVTNHFNYWRTKVEELGVLAFQLTGESPEEIRGVSLDHDQLPIIAVNQKDPFVARLFTLVHELTHLAIRRSGLCDIDDDERRPPEEQRVEVFCNHVAGAALVPGDSLLTQFLVAGNASGEWDSDELRQIAHPYGVSRETVLRRLLVLGRTSPAFYRTARNALLREYEQRLVAKKAIQVSFARNVPRETVSALGRNYVGLVLEGYDADRLTLNDVSSYLGVRVKHVPKIQGILRAG